MTTANVMTHWGTFIRWTHLKVYGIETTILCAATVYDERLPVACFKFTVRYEVLSSSEDGTTSGWSCQEVCGVMMSLLFTRSRCALQDIGCLFQLLFVWFVCSRWWGETLVLAVTVGHIHDYFVRCMFSCCQAVLSCRWQKWEEAML